MSILTSRTGRLVALVFVVVSGIALWTLIASLQHGRVPTTAGNAKPSSHAKRSIVELAGLVNSCVISGIVIDPDSKPVAGARVRTTASSHVAISEQDGSFCFPNSSWDGHTITAEHGTLRSNPITLAATSSFRGMLVLQLRAGVTISLRIFGEEMPIPHAVVTLGTGSLTREYQSNDSGLVVIDGLGAGHHDLRISAGGWGNQLLGLFLSDTGPRTLERSIALQRSIVVSGKVIGPDGRVVAGSQVSFHKLPEGDLLETVNADDYGYWTTTGLSYGTYLVEAVAPGLVPIPSSITVEDDSIDDVQLRVVAGRRISGVVYDDRGNPVSGARVKAVLVGISEYSSQTDSRGEFEIVGVRQGTLLVFTWKVSSASGAVKIDRAERDAKVTLILEETRISGLVRDKSRLGVPGVRVTVISRQESSPTRFLTTLSDAEGHFDLFPLAPGEYEMRVGACEGDIPARMVSSGTEHIDVTIESLVTIQGRVTFEGKPLTDFSVIVPDANSIGSSTYTRVQSADGTFAIEGICPSDVTIIVRSDLTKDRVITTDRSVEGRIVDFGDIDVFRAPQIAGIVVSSGGIPIVGARVVIGNPEYGTSTLHIREDDLPWETTSQTGGEFAISLRSTQMRSFNIFAIHPQFGISPVEEASVNGRADLMLQPIGSLSGVVVGIDRSVAVSATRIGEPSGARVATSADGHFGWDLLPVGEYIIEATDGEVVVSVTTTVVRKKRTRVLVDWTSAHIGPPKRWR